MSLFDVPRSGVELASANEGMANADYQQITCTRDVTGANFPLGVQQFRFETGGVTWWSPAHSYFRFRVRLRVVNAAAGPLLPPHETTDAAPAMGMVSHFYKSAEARLNGRTLERVAERLPQVDAVRTRKNHSKAWMDSIGRDSNFWAPSFDVRRQQTARQGYLLQDDVPFRPIYGPRVPKEVFGFAAGDTAASAAGNNTITFVGTTLLTSRNVRSGDIISFDVGQEYTIVSIVSETTVDAILTGGADAAVLATANWQVRKVHFARDDVPGKNEFELIWQPPLGLFELDHAIPPGGSWTIELNPQTSTRYQLDAVQSQLADLSLLNSAQAGFVEVTIQQVYFYLYTLDGPRFDKGSWYLDIKNMRCQLESMNADSTSLQQLNFDVSPKTTALGLAFQDQAAGVDTRRPQSILKIRPSFLQIAAPSRTDSAGQELLLERFFIIYNNAQKPTPDYDGKYQEDASSFTSNLESNYLTQRWVDTMMQGGSYHMDGGAEAFHDWIRRGPYYWFVWPKDASENATRVNVSARFRTPFNDGVAVANATQPFMMLFSEWRTAYLIEHEMGRVVDVTVEET